MSVRGGRAAPGAPHPGGAHPREGAPRPPEGLTARNTPDREQPSLRAQRHEDKALPSYRKEGSITSADNTGLPRTRGPGINTQIATQPPKRSLPLGALPINNDTKKQGGELRRPRSALPPRHSRPRAAPPRPLARGPPGPAHTEKP